MLIRVAVRCLPGGQMNEGNVDFCQRTEIPRSWCRNTFCRWRIPQSWMLLADCIMRWRWIAQGRFIPGEPVIMDNLGRRACRRWDIFSCFPHVEKARNPNRSNSYSLHPSQIRQPAPANLPFRERVPVYDTPQPVTCISRIKISKVAAGVDHTVLLA